MSKKKSKKVSDGDNNEDTQQKEENDSNKQKGDGGGKKEGGGGGCVVLKVDLHCEGCASKVVKIIRGFEGVENVQVDGKANKLTVTGKVDPVKIREKLEQKTHKKVELLTPVPKKEKEDSKSKDAGGDGAAEEKKDTKENKAKDKNANKNKQQEKNSKDKEPPVTTAVLKVPLHCEGCIQKIRKIVTKTKGCEEMKLDKQKDLVTVKGAMDMKALAETLKKHLKKDVEIIPPKKDEKKEKGNDGGGGGKSAGGGGGGSSEEGSGGGGGGEKMEGNRMQVQQLGYGIPNPYVYGPPVYGPGQGYVGDPYPTLNYHAPQMFSDENPNACTVM